MSQKDIANVAAKILKTKESVIGLPSNSTGTKIEIRGNKVDNRLGRDLIVTIYFDRVPLNQQMTVRFFWGHECRIDIIGYDDNKKRLTSQKLKELVVAGINEYIDHRSNAPYGMIDVDNFSGDY